MVAGFGPQAVQNHAGLIKDQLAAAFDAQPVIFVGPADDLRFKAYSAEARLYGFHMLARHLKYSARLFAEQRRQRIITQIVHTDIKSAVTGKCHFRQSDKQTAIAAVMRSEERRVGK